VQSYRGSFDQTLKDLLTNMQVKDMLAKREREAKLQQAIQGAYTTQPKAGLGVGVEQFSSPITQAEIEAFGPTAYAEAARTAAPMERTFDRSKALEALAQYGGMEGLGTYLTATKPADAPEAIRTLQYLLADPKLMAAKKELSAAGAPKNVVNTADPTAVSREVREIGKEFRTELEKRGLTEVADRYRALDTSVKAAIGGNKQAHGAIIYNVAKIYDPSGAVQEGDKDTVIGNRGIPSEIKMLAQKVFDPAGPGTLTPDEIINLYKNVTTVVQDKAALVDPIMRNYAADIEALSPGRSSRLVSPFAGINFGQAIGTTVRERKQ
jgi:hypothetical protein